jgi:putative addiction module antidote
MTVEGLTNLKSYSICYNMIKETKVRRIGNSLGVVLPKEVLHDLKVEEGATLYITGDAEGSIRLTAENPEFKEKMLIAEDIMHRYRNALRELAK